MFKKPIYVTKPTLAPLSDLQPYLERIWSTGVMTHNGPLVQQFEKEFASWAGVTNLVTVCNGTVAIQMAIKALGLEGGEIITTPFTFIATLSAIQWERCVPVFVDIDPETLNIAPAKIEKKITSKTVAILPVHVFGNPCEIEAIETLAKKHGLKVIYDAAHAVGSTYKGKSLLAYGDIAATSFHATKMLNTVEGGGCVTANSDWDQALRAIRFYGFGASKDAERQGLNGKMTEVHAAVGLANLHYLKDALADRKEKYKLYSDILTGKCRLRFQKIDDGCNRSYFPVIFESEVQLLRVEEYLHSQKVFPRRYFYPSVNTFTRLVPFQSCPISEDISRRILCLPLYKDLLVKDVRKIAVLTTSVA